MAKKPKRLDDASDGPVSSADSWRVFRMMAEFIEGFETLAHIGPAVTIFGSARTAPDDAMYKAAEQTAALLAREKFAVITGGGPGIMEAANKGAYDAGGVSIGCNISLPHEQTSNPYQTATLDFHYFYARKVMFVKYASAFICFPGGYGTLDEFFETITLIQTSKSQAFPVILYGSKYWSGLLAWLRETAAPNFISLDDLNIFRVVDSPKDAVTQVEAGIKRHWWNAAEEGDKLSSRHKHGPPLRGSASQDSGEGTRYGIRPRRAAKLHAPPSAKPRP